MRGVINSVIDDLATRSEYRVAQFRDWLDYSPAVERWLVAVLAVVFLAALGALTAAALTRPGSGTVHFLQSNAASVSTTGASTAPVDVVTRTVKAEKATVRVVRRPATRGNAVVRTVPGRGTGLVGLPGQTVRDVQTLTTQQIATVTEVQTVTATAPPVTVTAPPVTVTVVETVTCKPKDC